MLKSLQAMRLLCVQNKWGGGVKKLKRWVFLFEGIKIIGTLLVMFEICQQAKKVFLWKHTHPAHSISASPCLGSTAKRPLLYTCHFIFHNVTVLFRYLKNANPIMTPTTHTALDTQELVNLNLTQLVVWRLLHASLVTCSGRWPCVSALRVKLLLLSCLHCFDILCSSSEPCANTSDAKRGICFSEYNLGLWMN